MLALRKLEGVITTIRGMKRLHPKLVEEFSRQLHAAIDDDPPESANQTETVLDAEPGDESHGIERLIAWFRQRANEAATVQEMAKAVGLSERTIKSIMYMRHKGKFETTDRRGRNNRAYFRLAGE